MAQENFQKLDGTAASAVLKDINSGLVSVVFPASHTVVTVQALDFYPGYHAAELADTSQQPPVRRFALYRPGRALVLDGTATALETLNAEGVLRLNADTVLAYAKFFLRHVRGDQGAFKLVETLDDISWREEPSPSVRKTLNQLMAPLQLTEQTAAGVFILHGRLLFGEALFAARLTVNPDGHLSFDQEELLHEELPVRDDILGQ